jgi:MazG family protein
MKKHPIEDLIAVMAKLRDPNGGCPWDLEQDFKSIAPYTIEEAYEVADAIERDDMKDLREELGDLLLQPIYHAQMAAEAGLFDIEDVIKDVTAKMISRHPHVFGDAKAAKAEDVNQIWDERKSAEKTEQGSVIDGVAKGLPALLRAYKLQKKAAKVGFEWAKPADVLDKLEEETAEFREALAKGTIEDKMEEFGDLLFVFVNFARMLGIDSETALRQCNDKFERRFKGMEADLKAQSLELKDATLDQMEEMWVRQKVKEKAPKTA